MRDMEKYFAALAHHPSSLKPQDFRQISLSHLARNLPSGDSPRVLDTYLEWLEAHRNNSSRRDKHWGNTVVQWIQSLQARGISQSTLTEAVESWKLKNQPFRTSADTKRCLPTSADIDTAFRAHTSHGQGQRLKDENTQGKMYGALPYDKLTADKGTDSYRPQKNSLIHADRPRTALIDSGDKFGKARMQGHYQGVPWDKKYVCTRCGEKGHYLEGCPTNMVSAHLRRKRATDLIRGSQDPSFDRPPPEDYKCEKCGQRGTHWKSLCPQNQDPYSIVQKRQMQGISTPLTKGSSLLKEWESSLERNKISALQSSGAIADDRRLSRPLGLEFKKKSPLLELDEVDELIKNAKTLTGAKVQRTVTGANLQPVLKRVRPLADNSSPTPHSRRRKRMAVSDNDEADFGYVHATPFRADEMEIDDDNKDDCVAQTDNLQRTVTSTDGIDTIVIVDSSSPLKPLSGEIYTVAKPRKSPIWISSDDENDKGSGAFIQDDTSSLPAAVSSDHKYSDYVRRLIEVRGDMTDVVNPRRKRRTALSFWETNTDHSLLRGQVASSEPVNLPDQI